MSFSNEPNAFLFFCVLSNDKTVKTVVFVVIHRDFWILKLTQNEIITKEEEEKEGSALFWFNQTLVWNCKKIKMKKQKEEEGGGGGGAKKWKFCLKLPLKSDKNIVIFFNTFLYKNWVWIWQLKRANRKNKVELEKEKENFELFDKKKNWKLKEKANKRKETRMEGKSWVISETKLFFFSFFSFFSFFLNKK